MRSHAFEAAWLRAETGFCRMPLSAENIKKAASGAAFLMF
jgi:hypothetical protein